MLIRAQIGSHRPGWGYATASRESGSDPSGCPCGPAAPGRPPLPQGRCRRSRAVEQGDLLASRTPKQPEATRPNRKALGLSMQGGLNHAPRDSPLLPVALRRPASAGRLSLTCSSRMTPVDSACRASKGPGAPQSDINREASCPRSAVRGFFPRRLALLSPPQCEPVSARRGSTVPARRSETLRPRRLATLRRQFASHRPLHRRTC